MSCGPAAAAAKASTIDLSTQAVIQGTVVRDGAAARGGYARLLDSTGEFTAEVPLGAHGDFRFFAGTGTWRVRVLAPGAEPAERMVVAEVGTVTEVDLTL